MYNGKYENREENISMSITTVLFDLDGTLLPMDQDVFVKDYFSRIATKVAPAGYDRGATGHESIPVDLLHDK